MGPMYSRLEELELWSSPPRMRNGFPSTYSWVAGPWLRSWGAPSPEARETAGIEKAQRRPSAAAGERGFFMGIAPISRHEGGKANPYPPRPPDYQQGWWPQSVSFRSFS